LLPQFEDPRVLAALAVSAVFAGIAIFLIFRKRVTPEERERRRRLTVNYHRRGIEGFITEAASEISHFQSELRSVTYVASQDVSALHEYLPPDPSRLIGPVSVRFEPRNPANSIVVCEEWSGLPAIPQKPSSSKEPKEDIRCN
jgi:hypothetical protein